VKPAAPPDDAGSESLFAAANGSKTNVPPPAIERTSLAGRAPMVVTVK
jgi:hypothetical protein